MREGLLILQLGCHALQVYVVGDVGIQEELDLKGYQHTGGPADKDQVVELKPGYALPHDHDVSFETHCAYHLAGEVKQYQLAIYTVVVPLHLTGRNLAERSGTFDA